MSRKYARKYINQRKARVKKKPRYLNSSGLSKFKSYDSVRKQMLKHSKRFSSWSIRYIASTDSSNAHRPCKEHGGNTERDTK